MPVGCFVAPQLGIAAERARRPDLACAPLILVSEEGTVRAASDEAAARGVCEGNRTAGARTLCSDVVALPYDPECCEAAAASIRDALAVESSFVEPDGPELCFVEFDGRDVVSRCRSLREVAEAAAGVPIWAGLARNRLVSEAAALRREESRFTVVAPGREAAFLEQTPVDQVRRFDARLLDEMRRLGIQTLVPPAIMPVITISREFGAGGSTIAEMLACQLGEGWQVWDRQVLNAVAESGQLRSDMAVVLDERTQTWIERMAANLLNVRTTDPTFYRQHLAQV
ncbi:MAG TPA: cytidylate kinase family protein, partial [Chthonomonadales bacterium]|nr:cytidylate kinase family protein [Chthonomonadales bacterium]